MFYYKTDYDAIAPTRKSGDCGWDFYGLQEVVVEPGQVVRVRTGIVCGMPSSGFVWDKSSAGSKGLKVLGGVIDQPYVGEVEIILGNINLWEIIKLLGSIRSSPDDFQRAINNARVVIPYKKGLAQLVLNDVDSFIELSESEFKDRFSSRFASYERGEQGFGQRSTLPD